MKGKSLAERQTFGPTCSWGSVVVNLPLGLDALVGLYRSHHTTSSWSDLYPMEAMIGDIPVVVKTLVLAYSSHGRNKLQDTGCLGVTHWKPFSKAWFALLAWLWMADRNRDSLRFPA